MFFEDKDCAYNNTTLYLCSGHATQEDVEQILMSIGDRLSIDSTVVVNVIKNRNDELTGCGYAFVDPPLYNVLMGLNPDGTKRVTVSDDPNWVAPTVPLEQALKDLEENRKNDMFDLRSSWAYEDQLEHERENLKRSYMCPKITRDDSSLVQPDWLNYTYTENDNQITDRIDVQPAFVQIEDKYKNVMVANNIPAWITEDHVRPFFNPYFNGRIIQNGKFKGTPYPIIEIDQELNNLYICFNPNNYDCGFTSYMTKRIMLFDPKTCEPTVIMFRNTRRRFNRNKNDNSDNSDSGSTSPRTSQSPRHKSPKCLTPGPNIERPRSRNGYKKHLSTSSDGVVPRSRSDNLLRANNKNIRKNKK